MVRARPEAKAKVSRAHRAMALHPLAATALKAAHALKAKAMVVVSTRLEAVRWQLAIEKYIASFDELFSPTTDNESVRSRRAAAYLAVYNPFLPIASIQLVVPSADKGYIKDV